MLRDVLRAARQFARTPGFTLAAVLSLALGIGANTVIFTVVDAVLLRGLPYPEADRLFAMRASQSPLDVHDARDAAPAQIAQAGVFASWPTDLRSGDERIRLPGAVVSGGLLGALGVAPQHGRLLGDADDLPGAAPAAVITHRLWVDRFGAEASAVGTSLVLGGASYTLAGVMPEGFLLPGSDAQIFVPFAHGYPEVAPARNARFSTGVVRLAPGASLAQAQAALDAAARHLGEAHPAEAKHLSFQLVPLHEKLVGSTRPALLLLFAAVGLLLLVACVNFANLLVARGMARQRELAIRAALGATRGQLASSLLAESLLLGVAGGAAALVVAAWSLPALLSLQPPGSLPPLGVHLDWRVLGYALFVSLLAGSVAGLVPALRGARPDLHDVLKSGSTHGARGGERMRRALVIAELSLCIVLLVGTGLLLRSLWKLQSAPLGFAGDEVVSLEVSLPARGYAEAEKTRALFAALLRDARNVPGVAEAGLLSELPLTGSSIGHQFVLEGAEVTAGAEPDAAVRVASAGMFGALAIPILRGRAFADEDGPGTTPVAVVNGAFVRRYLGGRDPLGARLRWARGEPGEAPFWMTVIGVAGDIRHRSAEEPEGPAIYYPFTQNHMPWRRWTHVVARPAPGVPALALLPGLRARVHALDPQLAPGDGQGLRGIARASLAQRRFQGLLLGLFALVAALLAATGIYGVVSYSVARRTREIGVRMALGAQRGQVLALVLRQSLALLGAALILGALAAAAATQVLASSLYGVSRADPMTWSSTAALLLVLTLLASWLPARRAMAIDPRSALREE